jgi:hypothetical protein
MTSSHRHPKYGDGEIVGWFDDDMVMFRSNHGKTMLREATLTRLSVAVSPELVWESEPLEEDPPELPSPAAPPKPFPQVETEIEVEAEALDQAPEVAPSMAELQQLATAAKAGKRKAKSSGKIDLNKVEDPARISAAFPQMGKIGARKLFDKKPVHGWVSLNSVREFAGELFPTEESWSAFTKIFEV